MKPTVLIIVAVTLALASTVLAQESTAPRTEEFERWKTSELYDYGIDLVKRGRALHRAISALSVAARREPEIIDYQLGLGCALASRFASVGFALRQSARFRWEKERYQQRRKDWETSQGNPSHPAFGTPAPLPPPEPVTPDDGRPFEMGHDEALRLLVRLGRESMAALDAAHGLAENSTPEKRSEAEYIRGWALWLLKRYGKEVVNDRPVKSPGTSTAVSGGEEPNSFSIGQEDILSSFRQTVASDPKNAGYWHSLGLALVPRNVDAASEGGYDKYVSGEAIHQAAEVEEAIRAFERALSIKPSDPDMLYQAAMIVAPTSAEKAVKYLERAAQRVGMNAVLWYVLAQQRFRQFDTQGKNAERGLVAKAITAIENGNSAPQYWAIPFKLPTPILLRKAWDYSRVYGFGEDAHVVMVLTYRLSELVTNEMKHGEEELELRAIAAMMRMGLKAIGRLDASDLDRRDPRMRELHKARLTMGLVSCFKAYQLLKDAHQARPDPRKARVLAEFAGLMEYLKPLDQEVSQLP